MLINNPEFRTSVCCIIMMLTIIAAKSSASRTTAEGRIDDQSTGEIQDWRQPLPTVKRAMALLNKLVMVAQRANNKKHQDLKGQNRLTTKNSNHLSDENELIKHLDIDLAKTSSSEINNEDDHYAHQKAMLALPHRMGFERRGQKSSRVFWRCYFNAVSCFR